MTRAVVTLAVGPQGRDLHRITGPVQRAYAGRIGARYVVIDSDSISPGYPLAAKFQVSRIQPHFARTLFLDVDVLLTPDCPDLFDLVPAGTVGIYDDFPDLQTFDWLQSEYRALADSQGWADPTPYPHCRNTGVVVCDREHAALWAPPQHPYPRFHCSEQNIFNLNILRHGYPVHDLPKRFNYQWWSNKDSFATSDAPVLHFAGMSQPEAGGIDHAHRLREVTARAEAMGYATPADRPDAPCNCGGVNPAALARTPRPARRKSTAGR